MTAGKEDTGGTVTIEAQVPPPDRYEEASQIVRSAISKIDAWIIAPFDPLHRKLTQDQIVEFISDHWTAMERYGSGWFRKKQKDLNVQIVLKDFYENEFFNSYDRWCRIAGQKVIKAQDLYRTANEAAGEKGKITEQDCFHIIQDIFLRTTLFRLIPEACRSENGVTNLFFHTSRFLIGQCLGHVDANYKKVKGSSQVTAEQVDRIKKEYLFLLDGDIRFLYDLLRRVSFQRGIDLKYFLTKDDLNANCHIGAFVKCFLTKKDARGPADRPAYLFRFEAAFMSNKMGYATNDKQIIAVLAKCKTRVTSSPENQLTAYKETDEDKKLRLNFAYRWSTYIDQVGYIPGYAAFIANYIVSTVIQLLVLAVTLLAAYILPAVNEDFPTSINNFLSVISTKPVILIALCAIPAALAGVFVVIAIIGRLLTWPWRHPHFWSIPRRDSKVPLSYSLTMLWTNIINIFVWVVVFLIQVLILKYLLFEELRTATYIIVNYSGNLGDIDFILALVSLILAWAPIFLIIFTITPIIFYALICVMNTSSEFLQYCGLELFYTHFSNTRAPFQLHLSGMWNCFTMAIYGIHSRHLFKRRMKDERTLRFFAEKMLNTTYPRDNKDAQNIVKTKFAQLFNFIVQDFYEECLMSADEKEQFTFKIGQDSTHTMELSEKKRKKMQQDAEKKLKKEQKKKQDVKKGDDNQAKPVRAKTQAK